MLEALEVIVDTNIIIGAIFNQFENEDSWQILKLLRTNKIRPVVSEPLLREYQIAPTKMVIDTLFEDIKYINALDIQECKTDLYKCFGEIATIMFKARMVEVTSKRKECLDPEDDKLYNLAVDSNCSKIVTKNVYDFSPIDGKSKTKNGKLIEIYTPSQFMVVAKTFGWAQSLKAKI